MVLERIKEGLIVSCQALAEEPLHSSFIMSKMAKAAEMGGANGIRANSVEDIKAIRKETSMPVIGIIKQDYNNSEVYITATMQEVEALLETNCEIIALDATKRKRPNGENIQSLLDKIHEADRLAMADISTFEEGIEAEKLGFDLISTTLSGYTEYTEEASTPDFNLVKELSSRATIPVIMEGRTRTPEHVKKGLECGAYAVVVGSIITRPQYITKLYAEAIKEIK
ncbi:N-acetylmannosamine-6-phosphate 2-epimerase [Marinilactibacillus psychrotolerans]|uniref:Putative N-acetylmannosamine-6-phosphate 2-epimerase n=1 Tax=Marinilactibacillus psychrotolerans TaxID=191770 RepID=A0A5R9BVL0_9LACT|nr:N-acetylmannosamine-6-phosphate 2-epimerase [Marinilactibacillus psychrotolerans]TLQ04714.1 N-acetylmannosamine-6-phosphate 2-epimerase [Marinilactibacillus psychrotolerans]